MLGRVLLMVGVIHTSSVVEIGYVDIRGKTGHGR